MESLSAPSILIVELLIFVRFFSALTIIPFLGNGSLPLIISAALSIVLSLFFTPDYVDLALNIVNGGWFDIALSVSFEIVLGVSWGFMVAVCWQLFLLAGAIVQTSVLQPTPDLAQSPYSQLYMAVGTAVFLLMDGHHAVFAVLGGSLRLFPPGTMIADSATISELMVQFVTFAAEAFATGVMIAAPVMVAAMVAQLIIAFIGRLFGSMGMAGESRWPVKTVFLQIIIIGTLWKSVSWGVDFLLDSINAL